MEGIPAVPPSRTSAILRALCGQPVSTASTQHEGLPSVLPWQGLTRTPERDCLGKAGWFGRQLRGPNS